MIFKEIKKVFKRILKCDYPIIADKYVKLRVNLLFKMDAVTIFCFLTREILSLQDFILYEIIINNLTQLALIIFK
jgi:hypothetical protein